jgi:hypothetical protein
MKCEMSGRSQMSVTGADGDTIYTVEFAENVPNGACNCFDFITRCQKEWDRAGRVRQYGEPLRTRCKHVNAALIYIADCVVIKLNQ